MKTIGLLGGMSWESTQWYYQALNLGVQKRLKGLHSAQIILHSVDFAIIEDLQKKGHWQQAAQLLAQAAKGIEKAGADFLLICTNTMHLVADQIMAELSIPLLHIADATAENLIQKDLKKVALIGTAFTMEKDFYKGRLEKRHGIEVITPNSTDRSIIHQVIYDELCLGKIDTGSRKHYLRIIDQLSERGAQAVILGCTEIGLLVKQQDTKVNLLDTTMIHANKAVEMALMN